MSTMAYSYHVQLYGPTFKYSARCSKHPKMLPLRRVHCGAQKGTYAMQMCATNDGTRMGLACSDSVVRVYDLTGQHSNTLALARLPGQCRGHTDRINDLAPYGPAGLVSASSDTTARVWDLRTGGCVAKYEAVQYGEPVPLFSACANADATLVATGGEGGVVHLWDTRAGGLLSIYSDLHSEDITRLRFQPVWPAEEETAAALSRLVSAGEDGLMCITDVREPDMEEALIDCWSIGTIGAIGGDEQPISDLQTPSFSLSSSLRASPNRHPPYDWVAVLVVRWRGD